MLIDFLKVFLVGGLLCLIAQILMDATKLVSAEILVIYIVAGVILTAVGLYEPIIEFGKCGASVPLTGFGYSLVNGVGEAIDEYGFLGVFTGGFTATAAGISAAIVFGYLISLFSSAKTKY